MNTQTIIDLLKIAKYKYGLGTKKPEDDFVNISSEVSMGPISVDTDNISVAANSVNYTGSTYVGSTTANNIWIDPNSTGSGIGYVGDFIITPNTIPVVNPVVYGPIVYDTNKFDFSKYTNNPVKEEQHDKEIAEMKRKDIEAIEKKYKDIQDNVDFLKSKIINEAIKHKKGIMIFDFDSKIGKFISIDERISNEEIQKMVEETMEKAANKPDDSFGGVEL